MFTGGTLGFERTVIAVPGACPIAQRTLGGMRPIKAQFFACWTEIDIAFRLIAEAVGAEELRAVITIRRGNVGRDLLPFDGDEIVFGAICAVASHLSRPEFPAEADAPEQIEHRLIVHDALSVSPTLRR